MVVDAYEQVSSWIDSRQMAETSEDNDRNIDDVDNPDEYPLNPDDWNPPNGVKEEIKAKEGSDGRHRQWKNEEGETVRRWDVSGREYGKERGEHWHDSFGRHINPGGGLQ